MTQWGHWELVSKLYRERYGSLEQLEAERYARPPAPLVPVTPEEAWLNLTRLHALVRALPRCPACRPRHFAASRPDISRGFR